MSQRRQFAFYIVGTSIAVGIGSIVFGEDVLPLAAWALILYPVAVFALWVIRSDEHWSPK
jgi:hypothetical protein